jgi:hypothetical protein
MAVREGLLDLPLEEDAMGERAIVQCDTRSS